MQRTYRYHNHGGKRYEINDKFNALVEEASQSVLQNGAAEIDGEALEKAFTYQLSGSPDNVEAIRHIEYGACRPWNMAGSEHYQGITYGLKIKGKDIQLSDIIYVMENDTVRDFVAQEMPELTLAEIEAAQRVMVGLLSALECDVMPEYPTTPREPHTACPIRPAQADDLAQIAAIVRRTVNEIYPKYYPKGAVEFFLTHHSPEAIAADIAAGCVFAAAHDGALVGTVTVKDSEILRLFVLPEYQGNGIGGALMDFAEHQIVRQHSPATLAASLPAKPFYRKRGYRETDFHQITTPNGDVLCYDTMEKLLYQTIPW